MSGNTNKRKHNPHLAHVSPLPISINDGVDTPDDSDSSPSALQRASTYSGYGYPVVKAPVNWERRPSFLGFGISGSRLRQSIQNDKLFNYVEKSSRINAILDSRPSKLIGKIEKLYNWSLAYKEDGYLSTLKNSRLKEFYEAQNNLIEKYQEVDKLLDSGIPVDIIRNYSERNGNSYIDDSNDVGLYGTTDSSTQSHSQSINGRHRKDSAVPADVDLETGNLLGYNKEEELRVIQNAISVNFLVNVVLLFGKAIVAILTSSISIVASLIDSMLDFLSTLIIWLSNKLSQSKTTSKYPVGKTRLEPIGVLVFSIIIIISFLQVGIEALQRLIYGSNDDIVAIGMNSTLIMLLTIFSKLACYFWCKTIKSSSVNALTQDALVDVVFNTFSILMPLLGYHFQIYWFDPLGALLLSIYIVKEWISTCAEHISNLTGRSADKEDEQVVLYLCLRFAERIDKIKQIHCYHVGDSLNVEVDLILDKDLGIRDSHDIAEALQYTLEALPMVDIERAFVHIDYDETNYRGHIG